MFIPLLLLGVALAITIASVLCSNPGAGRRRKTRVEVEVIERSKENELKRDMYSFTVNLKTLIRIALNDPDGRREIKEALLEGPCAHTEKLGAANLKESSDAPDHWFTVFTGTSREVSAGQKGFLLRNQAGDRISLRMRSQQRKTHAATTEETPGLDSGDVESLVAAALEGNPAAASSLLEMADLSDAQEESEEVVLQAAAAPKAEESDIEVTDPFDEGEDAPVSLEDEDVVL